MVAFAETLHSGASPRGVGRPGAVRLYPSVPRLRSRTLAGDAAVLVLLLIFAWLGNAVHDSVADLNALSRGVTDAGRETREQLRQAGEAVGGVPIVGSQLRESLQAAGSEAGGTADAVGRESRERIDSLADLLGVLTWLVPSLLVLASYLPGRVRQVNRLRAGARAFAAGSPSGERRRLIAQRALYGLPYGVLLRHTEDPFGDFEAGRYDGLVAAELEAAGLHEGTWRGDRGPLP